MPRYQQILQDGTKFGHYTSVKGDVGGIAKKMARAIYKNRDLEGEAEFSFSFCQNRSLLDGGDKLYHYIAIVKPLKEPKEIKIGDNVFYKTFDISVRMN